MHYLKLMEGLTMELSTPTTLQEWLPIQHSFTKQDLSDNMLLVMFYFQEYTAPKTTTFTFFNVKWWIIISASLEC